MVNNDANSINIVRARGWVYAVLAGLALLLHAARHRMANAIDRRFFREQYDARHLLRDVAEQGRRSGSLDGAAPAVVSRIEAALHPTFAALLVRQSADSVFRPLAAAPAGAKPAVVHEESSIVRQMRATEKPLQLATGWHLDGEDEDRWPGRDEHHQDIALAVPITMSAGAQETMLALGARRSEEPYTHEDIDSLVAVAANLALLADRRDSDAVRLSGTFEECPECGTCYTVGSGRCAVDDIPLASVGMPLTLAGHYRFERRLDHGGMGNIYEATDTSLDRRVAVKVIRDEWVHKASAIARFRREARAVAALDHPNVVVVHDYGADTGRRAFLVMELLHGVTLREELYKAGRLGAALTRMVFQGVCGAVEAAHRHRIVHRDLKPENIFLAREGEEAGADTTVKVLDFGVAKPLAGDVDEAEVTGTNQTAAGVLVGTVGYMSPEQLLGERAAVSWDLWALAVVAYECLPRGPRCRAERNVCPSCSGARRRAVSCSTGGTAEPVARSHVSYAML